MSVYPAVAGPDPDQSPALAQLLVQLRERHKDAIDCILLYGSCLRSGDIFDGLLDLYLICEDYSHAYGKWYLVASNWLLPPNVFYAQTEHDGQVLRSKVTVISRDDFRRGCSQRWFQSYIWGRFAQPTRIVYSRNPQIHQELEECLQEAVHTLLLRALPALPESGTLVQLWEQALGLSYNTELRTERTGRAAELAQSAAQFYATVTRQQLDSLAFPLKVYDESHELHYHCHVPQHKRRTAGFTWLLRRIQGKTLSILRLVKALFTFEGALDYVAWKLERHSGQDIVIPDRVRRRPLIHMWGFFWQLYRRGIFK
jgi:hypothetical protein